MLFTVFILLLLTALVATDDPESRDETDLGLVLVSLPADPRRNASPSHHP